MPHVAFVLLIAMQQTVTVLELSSLIPNEILITSYCALLTLFSPDFQWVQGAVCEVQLMVYNPMPYELRVENMVSAN